MRYRLLLQCSIIIILLVLFSFPLNAQDDPSFSSYVFKKISWKNSINYSTVASWKVTGNSSSHLVLITGNSGGNEFWLTQHKLTDKGNLSQYGRSMFISRYFVSGCGSVWLEDISSPRALGSRGKVLIFIPAIRNEYALGFDLFVVGLRPSDGAEVIKKKVIFSRMAPSSRFFYFARAYAARGPNSIGVLITLIYIKKISTGASYINSSKIFFLETDFDGNPLGAEREVKLPNNGVGHWYYPSDLAHNGTSWIAAIRECRFRPVNSPADQFKFLGSGVHILTARGKTLKTTKIKLRKLFWENQDQEIFTFRNIKFLPHESSTDAESLISSAARGVTLDLFFNHWRMIDESKQRLDRFISEYGIVPINKKGKKAGPITEVDIPEWTHVLAYDPDKYIFYNSDALSNFIPETSGKLYLGQTRYLGMASRTKYGVTAWELEFNLYTLDRYSGDVTLRSRASKLWSCIPYAPVLRIMGSNTVVINHMQQYPNGKFENYFSKFK